MDIILPAAAASDETSFIFISNHSKACSVGKVIRCCPSSSQLALASDHVLIPTTQRMQVLV